MKNLSKIVALASLSAFAIGGCNSPSSDSKTATDSGSNMSTMSDSSKSAMSGAAAMPDKSMTGTPADGEAMAFVMAVDSNEINAANQAQTKKLSQPVMDYAKMLQTEHSDNADKTMALTHTIHTDLNATPGVDSLKMKGVALLAKLKPMDGKKYEAAYLDAMDKGHTEVLATIDNRLMPEATNDNLKKHLAETRGHVAMHLEMAKKLKASH